MKILSQFVRTVALLGLIILTHTAHAVIILESATLGPTGNLGGSSVSAQFLGSRFSLTSTHTITGIGGHLSTFNGSVWGALIELPTPTGLPSFSGLDIENNALISALFEDSGDSEDFLQPVNITLGAGDYALVFGGDSLFGSTGTGAMPFGGQTLLPGASNFFWSNTLNSWFNTNNPFRFVVEGVEGSPIPEPSSLLLLGVGLVSIGLKRLKIG